MKFRPPFALCLLFPSQNIKYNFKIKILCFIFVQGLYSGKNNGWLPLNKPLHVEAADSKGTRLYYCRAFAPFKNCDVSKASIEQNKHEFALWRLQFCVMFYFMFQSFSFNSHTKVAAGFSRIWVLFLLNYPIFGL